MTQANYAKPPVAEPSLHECSFYQTIDIPGLGVQPGEWDLRPNIAKYFGGYDLAGKSVLEIGAANGFVTFEMEKRGARVVSFDLAEELTYDAPLQYAHSLNKETYQQGLRRIRNGYWLAHRRFQSKARVAYGHANHLPDWLGEFDVGILANVMQHLQDPMGALMRLASRSRAVIVTETDWMKGTNDELPGMIYFDKDNPFVWYQVKAPLVQAVLRKMGYKTFSVTFHEQLFVTDARHSTQTGTPTGVKVDTWVPHYTVVATR